MSVSSPDGCADGATRSTGRAVASLGAADWLCLAATPAFATMALLTGVLGGGQPDLLCSASQEAFPLGGMVPMYVLMSAFHAAPWLRLVSGRRPFRRRNSRSPETAGRPAARPA